MSEPSPRAEKSHVLTWTLCILAALLLYPLSLGPIGFLRKKNILPASLDPYIYVFYTPLLWVYLHNPPLKSVLDVYIGWWQDLEGAP